MTVVYEWCAEVMCDNGEDISELLHADTAREAMEQANRWEAENWRLVLVRNLHNNVDMGLEDRQWAYVQSNGSLPASFDGGALIPNRFRKELARV